jgi:hypothetical protein
VQALADKKKNVTDEDVLALVSDEVHQPEKLWELLGLQVCAQAMPCHAMPCHVMSCHVMSCHVMEAMPRA